MTTPARETGPVILVDCPLCDAPSPYDAVAGELACAGCSVTLEVAPDLPPHLALPAAA